MAGPLLILLPALASDDWEAAAFARMLAEAILCSRPGSALVVPEEAGWPEGEAYRCRLAALHFGLAAEPIAALARSLSLSRAIAIGTVGPAIVDALAEQGVSTGSRTLADARRDPRAPLPTAANSCGLTRDQARARIDAPADRRLELAFPSAGAEAALAALDRIAAVPPEARRLLVLAGDWPEAEIVRQRAIVRGVAESLSFCGSVPETARAPLIAASELLHAGAAAGAYRGEAARLAAVNGTPIAGDTPPTAVAFGEAADWAAWALEAAHPPKPRLRPQDPLGIAVFLPSWKCRPWLPDAISSILAQSHRALHLFVCDDGGGDVDADLAARFPEATFLRTDSPQGPYAIANMLIAVTASDAIAFQDADDFSDEKRLAAQVDALGRLGLDGAGCNSRVVDLGGTLTGVEVRPAAASLALRESRVDMLLHPTSLFRRSAVESLGGFDSATRFGADTEFHFRAALQGALGNVSALLYTRRERPSSLTRCRATGFGSRLRNDYTDRVRQGFEAALGGSAPPPGHTLIGRAIPPADPARLRLVRAGRGCDPWLSQAWGSIRS